MVTSNNFWFIFLGSACLVCFLVGLVFTTGAGEYWLTLFDTYGAMGLTFIALIEILYVFVTCFHESWISICIFFREIKVYWHFIIDFDSPFKTENPFKQMKVNEQFHGYNLGFVDSEFVKTCDELVVGQDHWQITNTFSFLDKFFMESGLHLWLPLVQLC